MYACHFHVNFHKKIYVYKIKHFYLEKISQQDTPNLNHLHISKYYLYIQIFK